MKSDPDGKKRVAQAISMVYDGLKVYGKEPEQLENAVKLFNFALADYPTQQIVDAFAYYVSNFSEFPAPADIVQIIRRKGKPPMDKTVYVAISKKDACSRTSEEWQYMRDYETWMLEG